MLAVQDCGFALSFVPENIKNYEMCITVVKQNSFTLLITPDHFKDEDGNLLPKVEMERIWDEMHNNGTPRPVVRV